MNAEEALTKIRMVLADTTSPEPADPITSLWDALHAATKRGDSDGALAYARALQALGA